MEESVHSKRREPHCITFKRLQGVDQIPILLCFALLYAAPHVWHLGLGALTWVQGLFQSRLVRNPGPLLTQEINWLRFFYGVLV